MDDIYRAVELMVVASPLFLWVSIRAMETFFWGQPISLVYSLVGVLFLAGSLAISSIVSDWIVAQSDAGYGLFRFVEDHRILAAILGQAIVGASVWCVAWLIPLCRNLNAVA